MVRSADTIEISSGLPAIQFPQVSGPATVLNALGVVEMTAQRLAEPDKICRFINGSGSISLALYVNNRSDSSLIIPNNLKLNSLMDVDGDLIDSQPPDIYQPGSTLFTVKEEDFLRYQPNNLCPSGSWNLLGVARNFICLAGETELALPLCEARAEMGCAYINERVLKVLEDEMNSIRSTVKRLEKAVKRINRQANKRYSATLHLDRALLRISALTDQIRTVQNSCSLENPNCETVLTPKTQMLRSFRRAFGPRPVKGRIQYRAQRNLSIKRFAKLLSGLPDTLVRCS